MGIRYEICYHYDSTENTTQQIAATHLLTQNKVCVMKKQCRINIRLSDIQYREVDRRATYAGLPTAEYIRSLIQRDISTNTDEVIRRLARMIIFSSVAMRHLYTRIDHEGELRVVKQEADQLIAKLGVVNTDD